MNIISLEVMRDREYLVHVEEDGQIHQVIGRVSPGQRTWSAGKWTNIGTWTPINDDDLVKLNRFLDGLYQSKALNPA